MECASSCCVPEKVHGGESESPRAAFQVFPGLGDWPRVGRKQRGKERRKRNHMSKGRISKVNVTENVCSPANRMATKHQACSH